MCYLVGIVLGVSIAFFNFAISSIFPVIESNTPADFSSFLSLDEGVDFTADAAAFFSGGAFTAATTFVSERNC